MCNGFWQVGHIKMIPHDWQMGSTPICQCWSVGYSHIKIWPLESKGFPWHVSQGCSRGTDRCSFLWDAFENDGTRWHTNIWMDITNETKQQPPAANCKKQNHVTRGKTSTQHRKLHKWPLIFPPASRVVRCVSFSSVLVTDYDLATPYSLRLCWLFKSILHWLQAWLWDWRSLGHFGEWFTL